jgi:hypothetical protein
LNKNTLLTLLLISAICLFVNAVAGWALLNLGGLASAVLSLLFYLNVKKHFGEEAKDASTSSLVNVIASGAIFLLGSTLGVFLAIITIGISLIFSGVIVFLINIGLGIWQIIAWNKLKNMTPGVGVAA